MQFLVAFFVWAAGSLLARLLLGAGLAIGFHTWVTGAVEGFLGSLVSSINGLGATGDVLLLSGVGPAISIIGGALVARATIVAAGIWIGRRT